jgi:hypothetical protein
MGFLLGIIVLHGGRAFSVIHSKSVRSGLPEPCHQSGVPVVEWLWFGLATGPNIAVEKTDLLQVFSFSMA